MFNWEGNIFAAGIADQFPYPIRQLEKRYEMRKGERKTMMDILQEMNQMIEKIKALGDNEADHRRCIFLLRWMANYIIPLLDPLITISTTENWSVRSVILCGAKKTDHLCGY